MVRGDELRQEREEEQRGLRVEHVDDDPPHECAPQGVAPQLDFLFLLALEQLADPEIDEVGGAGVLDDAERERGGHDQRGEARCRGRHMDERAEVDSGNGSEPDPASLFAALDDDVEDSRARDRQQRQRSQAKQPERGRVREDHG